jgi:hypothetical protein
MKLSILPDSVWCLGGFAASAQMSRVRAAQRQRARVAKRSFERKR